MGLSHVKAFPVLHRHCRFISSRFCSSWISYLKKIHCCKLYTSFEINIFSMEKGALNLHRHHKYNSIIANKSMISSDLWMIDIMQDDETNAYQHNFGDTILDWDGPGLSIHSPKRLNPNLEAFNGLPKSGLSIHGPVLGCRLPQSSEGGHPWPKVC